MSGPIRVSGGIGYGWGHCGNCGGALPPPGATGHVCLFGTLAASTSYAERAIAALAEAGRYAPEGASRQLHAILASPRLKADVLAVLLDLDTLAAVRAMTDRMSDVAWRQHPKMLVVVSRELFEETVAAPLRRLTTTEEPS